MDDVKVYMENLDEYIYDENKVVTYKWLSITLQIPCNTAKRLLYHYMSLKKEEESKDDLHITYFVMGTKTTGDGQLQTKVHVVSSCELETIKKSFDTVLCEHVYSLSKSKLKDQIAALYTTDYECVRQNLAIATEFSGIVCPAAVMRSDADQASFRKLGTYRPCTPQDTRKAPDPRLVKPVDKPKPTAEEKSGSNKLSSNSKVGGSKGSVASMFATQNNVKKEPKETTAEKSTEEKKSVTTKKNGAESKKGGISNFFTKGANPRANEVKKEQKEDSPVKKIPFKSTVTKEQQSSDNEEPSPVKKHKKSPVKPSLKKNKSNEKTKSKLSSHPKRSRILQMDSDSSEEEEESDGGSNECPAPSPPRSLRAAVVSSDEEDMEQTEEKPHVTSPVKADNAGTHRGQKRKLVDKTYEEDGYLLTKKEYVYVTDSDSEEPVPPPAKKQDRSVTPPPEDSKSSKENSPTSPVDKRQKAKKAAPAKKNTKASPTKTKQASIMSFFKKK